MGKNAHNQSDCVPGEEPNTCLLWHRSAHARFDVLANSVHQQNFIQADPKACVVMSHQSGFKLLNEYRGSSITPRFTVVSQDGDFGFGDMILSDLGKHKIFAEKLATKERRNQWLGEHLTYPTPDQIFNHVFNDHKDRSEAKDGFILEDIPIDKQPMDLYYRSFMK